MLSWTDSSNNHIPTQNTALVQPVKKSRIILVAGTDILQRHGDLALVLVTVRVSVLALCTPACTCEHVCMLLLFERGFAVLCYANLLRQQDQPCPEAMG